MTNFEGIPKEKQQLLKEELLSGKISVSDFLNRVDELDQADKPRSESEKNLPLLLDPEVQEIILKDQDAQDDYYNLLSMAHHHNGQRKTDTEAARKDFEGALEAARHIESKDYDDWKLYMEANVARINKDVDAIKRILPLIRSENAKKDVVALLDTLI